MIAVNVDGWVLAGGRSQRMGRDKAGMELAGISLLERMLGKLRKLGLEARVAGMREPVEGVAAEVVSDLHPNCGPLSGMESALSRSERQLVMMLGVDLPLVETGFLRWMLERAQVSGAAATIPRMLGQPQPLCAVYRRELRGGIERSLNSGDYKTMTAVESAAAGTVLDLFDVERAATLGAWDSPLPVHCQFLNCNTRGELAAAAALLARTPML
ncbi:MAG: molybdenum cofactor guanylyltransferase [Acidobacteriaceae bacterium]